MVTEFFGTSQVLHAQQVCLIRPSSPNPAAQTWISIFIMLQTVGTGLGVDAASGCTGYGVLTPGTPWTVTAEREGKEH